MRKLLGGNMRKLLSVLALIIISGCAGSVTRPETRKSPEAMTAMEQYRAAQNAFQEKLGASTGLTLAELRSGWGQVRQGITQNQLTIYHWVRTISVVPPPEAGSVELRAASDAPDGRLSLSCMAVFIVNQGGVVDEAFSEGRCLDHNYMPGWKPVIQTVGQRT